MIKVKRIDHVALAVPSLEGSRATLASLFGLGASAPETVSGQKVDVSFLHPGELAGDAVGDVGHLRPDDRTTIELVCPNGNEALARFVSKRGEALHHICFEVDDLAGSLSALRAAGVPLIDEAPRVGARGHLVAFIHPRATGGVLFELCEPAHREAGASGAATP